MAAFDYRSRLIRLAALPAALLVGATLVGCADAFTFSKTETSLGMVKLQEGDAEDAALIFQNQVRRSPNDYKAHYHLGLARLDSGRGLEAIRSFKTALEVMPLSLSGRADDEYRFYIIDALSGALAQYDPDGSQLEQIELKSKGNPNLKLLAAMTHAKAGRPDNAIDHFNQARQLDRQNPQVAKQFGLYLESIAQAKPAEQELRRAYRLDSRDEQVAAALRRLGIVPGPAILSSTELAKPAVPLGPLPEIQWKKESPVAGDQTAPPSGAPVQGAPAPAPERRGLN